MSGTKNDGNNSHNETENQIKKPTTAKKYPFQTTMRKNSSGKNKQENTESLIDNKLKESENDTDSRSKDSQIEILKQVVNEPIKQDSNLPKLVSETASLKVDTQENKDHKPALEQVATETFVENKIELDVIEVAEKKEGRKKIRRKDLTEKEVDEICGDRDRKGTTYTKTRTPGLDPRFQQQNQTMRCFVMYTDFYRCENILGKGEVACQWFKDVFTSICPLDWIRRWDEAREEGRLGWTKGRTQGKFPGDRYGV